MNRQPPVRAFLCTVFLLLCLSMLISPAMAWFAGTMNVSQIPPGGAVRFMGTSTDGYSPQEYLYLFVTNQTFGGSLRYDGVRPDNLAVASISGLNNTFVQVWVMNDDTYNYTWNTATIAGGSLLPGSEYHFILVNQSLNRTSLLPGTWTQFGIAIEGPITPSFTATPPAGYAPLMVEFADSSTGYPTSYMLDYGDGSPPYTTTWWSANPIHTYALPGTYNVTLTVTNSYGPRAITHPVSVLSRTSSVGGGHNTRSSAALLQQPQQPAPAPLPGPVGIASQSYVIGTDGVRFEKDPATGGARLTIDYAAATAGGAVVIFNEKRVTVYHRHSPGVLLTFYSDHFTNENGTISGDVTRAEFLTDPVTGNMTYGHVDAAVGAEMFALPQDARVNVTLRENVTEGLMDSFRSVAERNNMAFTAAAFTYEVRRIDFATTGAANVTFSLPSSWVEQHGGTQDMKIFRVSDGNGTAESIRTTYTGTDPKGNMVFRGDSFNGTSIFGLVAAKASAIKQEEEPQATIVPSSKPAIVTDIGMFSWLATVLSENPLILLLIIALVAGVVYFGWYRRRRLP